MAQEVQTKANRVRRRSSVPTGPPARRHGAAEVLVESNRPIVPITPQHARRGRKRLRSASPSGPPLVRSISPSGPPPRLKRSRTGASGRGELVSPTPPRARSLSPSRPPRLRRSASGRGELIGHTRAKPEKALLMAWLKDATPAIRALLTPDASGHVVLSDHKVQLGRLELEQQRPLEKYGARKDSSMGWQPLLWDTPVYAEPGRPIFVRYRGVQDLHNWEGYALHLTGCN
ncbi:hypothetical protein B0H19DRAFT_1085941 [Mycena capillaripes]|nr:hypothetical protein B0H19DRAFT_1085941 [Mycena capillaripes]